MHARRSPLSLSIQQTLLAIAVVMGISFVAETSSAADAFRVETEIFIGDESEPVVEYLTLFADRVVYDFRVTKPEEITVYDPDRGRIVLLAPDRKWKTTISHEEILRFTSALKSHIDASNPVFYAAAHPGFGEATELDDQWLTLENKYIRYRIKGERPKTTSIARRYRDFADWSARLNSMRPGNLPPFARIDANQIVAEKGWIPLEVERVVDPNKLGQKKLVGRSKHLTSSILSGTDRKRIDAVGDQLTSFEEVTFTQFRDATVSR